MLLRAAIVLSCLGAAPAPCQAVVETAQAVSRGDSVAAQAGDSVPVRAPTFVRLPSTGGLAEDRLRVLQLRGQAPTAGFLLRSPSTQLASGWKEDRGAGGRRFGVIAPELDMVWNSRLPFSLNEGALWAGRGLSTRVRAGLFARVGRATLVVAPEWVHQQNLSFQTTSYPEVGEVRQRDPLASPFHYPPRSMDLPLRFGREAWSLVDPGQSSLTILAGPVTFGAATESLWWGPGIRNALVMSDQAPGIPHVFLATASPVRTRIGSLEGRWIVGRLEESDYFDFDSGNDFRSLSALAIVFSPSVEPELSLGFTRAVYAPAGRALVPIGAAFDVLRDVGRPAAAPGDTLLAPAPDQLFSFFARWAFPGAGFEAYGEWGRYEQPASLGEFLELPQHSRGYTLGVQYVRPLGTTGPAPASGENLFRLQIELTSLEPSTSYRVRPESEWYASRTVPQGYTHRGRAIGAAIGPSGSSQWIAGDVLGRSWQAGAFAGRIRWENQAQFTYLQEFRRADVSLFGGLRGGVELGSFAISAEYQAAVRLNYLFQARLLPRGMEEGVDIRNSTVRITLSSGRFFR